MKRTARVAGWIGIGLLTGLVLALIAIQVLTRTSFGHERVRNFALGWLQDQVNGQVQIGRIGGNLLGGVRLYDFAIRDDEGRTFVAADSAEVSYAWRTLLAGDIVLDRIVLHSPTVLIERLPGQDDWNFERIFADSVDTPDDGGPGRLILFEDVSIVNGTVELRTPWEPDADTARVLRESVPGGEIRIQRFANVDATLEEILWESPIEEGRLFRIESLTANAYLWSDPLVVRGLKGVVTLRDTVLAFEAPVLELPGTQASALGRVYLGDDVRYDVQVDATRLALSDLRWLLPRLPEGGGSLQLRVQSQDAGTLFLVENATLTAPGTQVAGSFGVVTGDSLYFTRVDLRASPLDLELIEQILPGTLPVEGLLIGTVEVEGPIAALRTSGNVTLSSGSGEPSGLAWTGTLDLRGRPAARSLRARLRGFELAVLDQFRPGLNLPGRVDGTVDATGSLDGSLRFTADLQHTSRAGVLSELSATGSIDRARFDPTLAIEVDARSLAFGPVAEMYPSLGALAGELRGPVRLEGPLDDLAIAADLVTDGGPVALDLRIGRDEGGRPRYGGNGRVSGFRLDRLREDLPEAAVSGRFAFDLEGASLAELQGTATVDFDSVGVIGLGAHRVIGGAFVSDGVLRLDSLRGRVAGGLLTAEGSLGLVEGRSGAIGVEFESSELEGLEPVIFGSIEDPTSSRVLGSGTVGATLEGWIRSLEVHAQARMQQLTVGPATVGMADLSLNGQGIGGESASYELRVDADSLAVFSRVLDTARVEIDYAGDLAEYRVVADGSEEAALRASGSFARGTDVDVFSIGNLVLGAGDDAWSLDAPLDVQLVPGRAEVAPFRLTRAAGSGEVTGGGAIAWVADSAAAAPMDFAVQLAGMPITEVVRFTESEETADGTMYGTLSFGGYAEDPRIDADLRVDQLRWGTAFLDSARADFDYADRLLAGRFGFYGDARPLLHGTGGIPVDLRFAKTESRRLELPLSLDVRADSTPLTLATAFLDGFTDVQGVLDGRITAAGTSRAPELDGAFVIRRGAATWSATGVRYRDLAGTMLLRDSATLQLDLTARAGPPGESPRGGGARVQGTLDLSTLSDPAFDLRVRADRLLAALRRDIELTASGEITLQGRYSRPLVGGDLTVDDGALYLDELYRQVLIVGLEDPLLFDVVDTSLVSVKRVLPESQSPFLRNLAVQDLQVNVVQGAWLRSRDMNVQVAGNLTVDFDRRAEDLRMIGTLVAVRGTYQLYYPPFARRFEVREGTVEFPGTPGIDPNLRISAAYRARTPNEPLDIIANVTGTLRNPRVRLSSAAEPPISESDLASYLFFGVPTYALDQSGASDESRDGFAGLGVSAFAPTALGYVASGLQTLAQNFGLVDYVGLTAAEATPGTMDAGLGGLLATTEIELGRYLSPTMFVAYTQRLAAQNYSAGVRLEWRFHPTFTAEAFAEDRFARAPSFGYTEAAALRKVYGFSLFREWGY